MDWMNVTPREAMLEAENAELRAKLKWACASAMIDEATLSPMGISDRIEMTALSTNLTMPLSAKVAGVLTRGGNYSVFAETSAKGAENLQVGYYVNGAIIASGEMHLLADMHKQFILTLAKKLKGGR